MTKIMSYRNAVLDIREEVANRDKYIITGDMDDMIRAMRLLGDRKCAVWINADDGPHGVFKVEPTDDDLAGDMASLIAIFTTLFPHVELGVVAAVSKVDGLPDKLPTLPGKDLLSLNGNVAVMAAEAMRTIWPDSTVLAPEDTVGVTKKHPETSEEVGA